MENKKFYLFPNADKTYFSLILGEKYSIYYVNDKYEYINPESSKFWSIQKAVLLLNMPKNGLDLWAQQPRDHKEKFLPLWEKETNYRVDEEVIDPSSSTTTTAPLSDIVNTVVQNTTSITSTVIDNAKKTVEKTVENVLNTVEDVTDDTRIFIEKEKPFGALFLFGFVAVVAIFGRR